MKRVVSEGLWDFRAPGGMPDDWEKWLHGLDLGALNYLLNGTSEEIRTNRIRVPFLRPLKEVWPRSSFDILNSLAETLKTAMHDAQTSSRYEPDEKKRVQTHFKAVKKVGADSQVHHQTYGAREQSSSSAAWTTGTAFTMTAGTRRVLSSAFTSRRLPTIFTCRISSLRPPTPPP